MPLHDHFHSLWAEGAPWEAIGSMWVTNVVRFLNKSLPKGDFRAHPNIHLGHMVEAGVAEFARPRDPEADPSTGGVQTATIPAPVLTFDPSFPDEFAVRIHTIQGSLRLVAVIEFVSPSNKDREETRRKFVSKCVGYLQLGIGLVIVDTITNRHANLHNELIRELGGTRVPRMPDTPTYIASYRPYGFEAVLSLDVWPYPAVVGQPVPSVPLPLKDGPEVMIDFEATYMQSLADQNL